MQQKYPNLPGVTPKTFLYGEVGDDYRLDGLDMECFTYPAFPVISRALNGFVGGQVLKRRLATYEPDLVLAYWVYPDGYAALRAARTLGIPCVVGALGSDIHVRSGINTTFTGKTVRNVDALLTVSENMREAAIREFGALPEKVHTIVNGFNTNIFRVQDRAKARAVLGVPADVRLIIYVGRFVEAKGMRELITAFRQLSSADDSLRLALVGDGVMRDELATLVAGTEFADRVLMPGGQPPEQVAQWIAAADVLTLPSWSEGYPNVVVEAIACGRPVVATDVGGTREIVQPSNGILIPARDPKALADALGTALTRKWDEAAIAAEITRSWDDVAVETLAVCDALLTPRSQPLCKDHA
jgi:glycosyltransferase involved in cell wall biosynthesis